MLYVLGEILLWLIPAFLVGLALGWWLWGRLSARVEDRDTDFSAPRFSAERPTTYAAANAPTAAPSASPFLSAPMGKADDLRLLKGVGEGLNTMLNRIGVYHFSQIANWTANDIAQVDQKLEQFKGRIERDQWVLQAQLLNEGRHEEFRKRFGEIGSELKEAS